MTYALVKYFEEASCNNIFLNFHAMPDRTVVSLTLHLEDASLEKFKIAMEKVQRKQGQQKAQNIAFISFEGLLNWHSVR